MINQVTLVGRLTRDPELKTTTEGTHVTHITLAVNRHYRNHNGEFEADFVQCTLWRNAAENTCKYCRKGAVLGVTGRLQTRHYEKEGKRVYVTEVIAESVRFLSAKPQRDIVPEQRREAVPEPRREPIPKPRQEFVPELGRGPVPEPRHEFVPEQSRDSAPEQRREEVSIGF